MNIPVDGKREIATSRTERSSPTAAVRHSFSRSARSRRVSFGVRLAKQTSMTRGSRIALCVSSLFAVATVGCAGTVRVKPLPVASSAAAPRAASRVSLYLASGLDKVEVVSKSPSGDAGLGDITVKFDLGPGIAGAIRDAARMTFSSTELVATPTCADHTSALFEAALVTAPYVQVHWRDETPRVGGGSIAEIVVRVIRRDCNGRELARAVAYGLGRNENMQVGGNWPSEDDFRPGVERALSDLESNMLALFADMNAAAEQS